MALYEMHVSDNLLFVLITVWEFIHIDQGRCVLFLSCMHSVVYNFICLSFWWEFLIYFVYMRKFLFRNWNIFVRCRCEMLQDIQFFFQSSVSVYISQWCINTHVFISPYHLLWLEFKKIPNMMNLNAVFP